MKLYVASTLSNADRVKEIQQILRDAGHEITYSWAEHGTITDRSQLKPVAILERDGVWNAEALVFVTPVAEGSCIEFGIAVGKQLSGIPMPIYLLKERPIERYKTFYELDQVRQLDSVGELLAALTE
jgi:hypothetical protein